MPLIEVLHRTTDLTWRGREEYAIVTLEGRVCMEQIEQRTGGVKTREMKYSDYAKARKALPRASRIQGRHVHIVSRHGLPC